MRWWSERVSMGLMPMHPTHNRSFRRRFLQAMLRNQQHRSSEGRSRLLAGVFQRDGEHTHERRRRRRVQNVPLPGRRSAPVRRAEGRLPAFRQPRVALQRPAGRRHRQRTSHCHGLHRIQARIRHLSRRPARVEVRST